MKDLDFIACEDTRITKRLFSKYNINAKLIVYNDVNSYKKKDLILDLLLKGSNIGLVSDAGTPCISDPGYRLINLIHKNNIDVYTVPGASSVQSALSVSGLPTDSYFFQGFLPKKKGRQTKLIFLSQLESSIVIFESPKRLVRTLEDIKKYFGDRIISICKELTKIYENVMIGEVSDLIKDLKETKVKGEYVLVIAKEGYIYK